MSQTYRVRLAILMITLFSIGADCKQANPKDACQIYYELKRKSCEVDTNIPGGHLLTECRGVEGIFKHLIRSGDEPVLGSRSAPFCTLQNMHRDEKTGKVWMTGVTHTSFGTDVLLNGSSTTVVGRNGKRYTKTLVGIRFEHEFDGRKIEAPSDQAVAAFVEGAEDLSSPDTSSPGKATDPTLGEYLKNRLRRNQPDASGGDGIDR